MTLEELKYLVSESYNKHQWFIGIDDLPKQISEVENEGWTDEGKYSYRSDYYKDNEGNHFRIDNSRSGRYHSDYYYHEPYVFQVEPKVETITRVVWKEIK